MHALPRITALQDQATGAWYVFDRLQHRLVVPVRNDAETALAQAGLWDAFWHQSCRRWQRQERPPQRWRWWRRP